MDSGYVRLWRKSIDSGWLKNKNVWIFWTWCLMKANHKTNHKSVVGFQEVFLNPGDFIFGLNSASKETFMSIQNIRTCLNFLKKSKNLTIKSTNKFSIISITNWGTYQYTDGETNNQSNTCLTSSQQASNNKQEHINNITKEKKKIKKKSFSPPTISDVQKYFAENGYSDYAAQKAFNYYDSANWIDGKGNQVKNWKQKMIGVWFKNENKINSGVNGKSEPKTQAEINKAIAEALS